MTVFNYGSKNGMSTLIKVCRHLCHVYMKFQPAIVSYINGSSLISDDKATVIAWLNAGVAACAILETIQITYES